MTAVLLIGWRRPDTISRVLAAIAESNPDRLYVSLDGPRRESKGEAALCEETFRRVQDYSGTGQLIIRRLHKNSGARGAILGAIDWFFSAEKEGIILEDDSLPKPEFFEFCGRNLERFRNEPRVFQIAGTNYLKNQFPLSSESYFSAHMHIWGFGTWARSWEKFQELVQMPARELVGLVDELSHASFALKREWKKRVRAEALGLDDNWDSTWNLAAKIGNSVSLTSAKVMVTNIGYDSRGLHSNRIPLIAGLPPSAEEEPLIPHGGHTLEVDLNPVLDEYTEKVQWGACNQLALGLLGGAEKARRLGNRLIGRDVPSIAQSMQSKYLTVAEKFWAWWLRRRLAG